MPIVSLLDLKKPRSAQDHACIELLGNLLDGGTGCEGLGAHGDASPHPLTRPRPHPDQGTVTVGKAIHRQFFAREVFDHHRGSDRGQRLLELGGGVCQCDALPALAVVWFDQHWPCADGCGIVKYGRNPRLTSKAGVGLAFATGEGGGCRVAVDQEHAHRFGFVRKVGHYAVVGGKHHINLQVLQQRAKGSIKARLRNTGQPTHIVGKTKAAVILYAGRTKQGDMQGIAQCFVNFPRIFRAAREDENMGFL